MVCNVRAESEQERDALLLNRLAATRPVTAISAYCVMHTFFGGPTGGRGAASALTEHQAAQLAPPAPVPCTPRPASLALDELTASCWQSWHTTAAPATRGWPQSPV
ncbi:hypothetical protein ACFTXM_41345 [Streptomyces sp. NPDC056930]|uniref:hypothetical protein n=1 Tax=Streptomyces sp. NPDC056930 TaxID=3345967 RepID=UPI0036274FFE